MSDLEHAANNTGPGSEQRTSAADGDTTQGALRSASGMEQPELDAGTLGVRPDGDLADVDPLAVGLDDAGSSLGEVVTDVMDDNRTEGVQQPPPNTATP